MHSYSFRGHAGMISDNARVSAYAQALRQAVRPGCVVGEIGAGTGIFSLLACQLGAQRVYAIEVDSVIQVARTIAAANGYADRIVFIHGMSTRINLPERCDVIVSDLRGVLPWHEGNIPSIVDARQRFLASGGCLIPQKDHLWAAVVEAPELHSRLVTPWTANPFGLDMRAACQVATNAWQKARVNPEQLLTSPELCAELNYTTVTNPQLAADVSVTAERAGMGSGILVWFDSILSDEVQISNSPFKPELLYGSAFFPWPQEVPLRAGDRICVGLKADLVEEDYVWRWETRIHQPEDRPEFAAHFRQSTFEGTPLTAEALRKRDSCYAPVPDEEGQIEHFILASMNGRAALWEIAGQLMEKFPGRFANRKSALDRVARSSQKHAR